MLQKVIKQYGLELKVGLDTDEDAHTLKGSSDTDKLNNSTYDKGTVTFKNSSDAEIDSASSGETVKGICSPTTSVRSICVQIYRLGSKWIIS